MAQARVYINVMLLHMHDVVAAGPSCIVVHDEICVCILNFTVES